MDLKILSDKELLKLCAESANVFQVSRDGVPFMSFVHSGCRDSRGHLNSDVRLSSFSNCVPRLRFGEVGQTSGNASRA